MSIERIIERQIERDEEKWDAEATAALDADPDYKAYLQTPEATGHDGPMTPVDKAVRDARKRLRDRLAVKMRSHYIDTIPAAPPMIHDIAVEAIDDFNWQSTADGYLDCAIEKLPTPVSA